MSKKKTLVLGATNNPSRFAFLAVGRLLKSGFDDIKAIGIKKGDVQGIPIERSFGPEDNIHTITLYLNPSNQKQYYDQILESDPKRIIFNPGTENSELQELANEAGIETIEACTLVMLANGTY